MHVPLWWCLQMTGRSLFWHGRAEVGTRNNKENCKGSGQNMPKTWQFSVQTWEARHPADPERNWQAAWKGGLGKDPLLPMAL